MTDPSDDRNALATGMAWATRAMTVSLEMVVPGVIGIGLDRFFGTVALFTMLGFAGGLTLAIWHLVKIGSAKVKVNGDSSEEKPRGGGKQRRKD